MRIDRIHLKNFKLFEEQALSLHPNFTLLIGQNGAGKTSYLEALAIAAGIWLYDVPEKKIKNSRMSLTNKHIRLLEKTDGDRTQFVEASDCIVSAWGQLTDSFHGQWTQEILHGRKSKVCLKDAREITKTQFDRIEDDEKLILPIIAYYGAGRAWLPHAERSRKPKQSKEIAKKYDAYYDCLSERIRVADLIQWFWDETTEKGNSGKSRPGFEIVKWAILKCIPDADGAWFDTGRRDIVLSINGVPQPFSNISAGQRTMLALVADIAIKMVTLNNFLVPPDEIELTGDVIPDVIRQTPGVVLIDEIEVHLHPKWQRRVVDDLRATFPNIQFVASTHSPFVVQSVRNEELRNLHGQAIPELGNVGVERISRGLMNIERPDVGHRYDEMLDVAKDYLLKLEEAQKSPPEKLQDFKEALAKRIEPYADNPAFQAYLELKAEGKITRLRQRQSGDTGSKE